MSKVDNGGLPNLRGEFQQEQPAQRFYGAVVAVEYIGSQEQHRGVGAQARDGAQPAHSLRL
ncbi:MAG: hypothetical protein O2901_12760 [Verrucomicrobia bacterium]|nr:hypothetical protein [Verrucomicrobiota bacterium]